MDTTIKPNILVVDDEPEMCEILKDVLTQGSYLEICLNTLPERQLYLGYTFIDKFVSLTDLEDEYISYILKHTGGNKSKAAEILGVNRRTIYRKREKNNLNLKIDSKSKCMN